MHGSSTGSSRPTLVIKCGGRSVSTPRRMRKIAAAVVKHAKDHAVVVVVSAMGKTTDKLIRLAEQVHSGASQAEKEAVAAPGEDIAAQALALAIKAEGGQVRALNTHQFQPLAYEDGRLRGRLHQIRGAELIQRRLAQGEIVVVPGYKGVTDEGEIVTLGRGASDLLASALAVTLKAILARYWKDVPGLYPVNPKWVTGAWTYDRLTYAEARELAAEGVLMERCIDVAESHLVPLLVELAPSISGRRTGGTWIGPASPIDELEPLPSDFVALTTQEDCALVEVAGVPNRRGWAARVFEAVEGIVLGNVVQGPGRRRATIAFTVANEDLSMALMLTRKRLKRVRGATVHGRTGFAGITLTDRKMRKGRGYMKRISRAVRDGGANIELISAPAEKIYVTVVARHLRRAAQATAVEFGMVGKSRRKAA